MSYRDPKDARIAQLEAEIESLKRENINLNFSPSYEVIKIDLVSEDVAVIFVKGYEQGQLSKLSVDAARKIRLGSKIKWAMQLVEE